MLIDFRKLFPKYNIKPQGVLHVGANVGEEAPVYDELGINNVVWVEANPYICQKTVDNVSKYRHTVLNFAATDEDGQVILHESNNGSQSSSILELGTHKEQHPDVYYVRDIPVLGQRIDALMEPRTMLMDVRCDVSRLDFLNMDIQGAEMKALRGMINLLGQFKWLYLEVNKAEVYKGCAHVNDLDLFLNGFGFKRVETHSWIGDWSDALYIRK